jgi:long-subunit fatty acid transport protein
LVEADLDGTVTSQVMGQSATTEADATSKIKYVDKIAAGVTYEFIENTLNASLDYELVFYSRSEDIQVVTSAGTASAPQRFHNNNLIKLGGEYMLKPELPLRAGFALIDYYRDTTYLNYTSVDAPSLTYVFALGTGFRVSDKFVANFAYNFYYQNGTVSGSAANAGQYKNIINTATLGFEYKL